MTEPDEVQTRYLDLLTTARAAAEVYYNDPENVLIPDDLYDQWVDEIAEIERQHPHLISDSSPTQVVGAQVDGGARHPVPMLSLSKITDNEAVARFMQEIGSAPVVLQLKADGVSMSLHYEDGRLVKGLTRGDGAVGEDVTETIRNLPSVPTTLSDNFTGIVRGEVLIHNDELPEGLKNARNGAAGSINHKDPRVAARRNCRFYAFDVLGFDSTSLVEALVWAKRAGFSLVPTFTRTRTTGVIAGISDMFELLQTLPYSCDGVVVKVDDFALREELGNRSNSPRWAFAFKRSGASVETILREVVWQVGKSGLVAPVALLEPVDLDGTTISRATLHNQSEIARMGLKIGATVEIVRAGAVIPRVERLISAPDDAQAIEIPTECPACESPLEQYGNSGQIRCTGDDCSATLVRRLIHWASKAAADIDAIGPNWVGEFVDAGLLNDVADFYANLTTTELRQFNNMGLGRITKFRESIENSKQLGMRKALIGLSLPGAGAGTAERLCRKYASVEEVAAASIVDLMSVDDLGMVVATSVREFFQRPGTQALLIKLREAGVNLDRLPEDAPLELSGMTGEFVGLKVCVTGKLSCSRDEMHELLKQHGATIVKSVSSKTDILLAGGSVGAAKTTAAKKHGVRVISEEEARKVMS